MKLRPVIPRQACANPRGKMRFRPKRAGLQPRSPRSAGTAWIAQGLRLALLALVSACALQPQAAPAPRAAITAAGAGLGMAVEYVKPEDFRDPGGATRTFFPVKFVCGEAQNGDSLAPAVYTTSINVVSLTKFKTRVGWQFIVVLKTVVGAAAELRSYGTVEMDCAFILANLVSAGVSVGPFVEGFLLIEALDRTTVRVVAVYSALHKQLHGDPLPDLVPVETEPKFCKRDAEGRLIVTIGNQGDGVAGPSFASIAFATHAPVPRSTPAIGPGGQADLAPVEIPIEGEGIITFTIAADTDAEALESDEFNNRAFGTCTIIN